MHFLHSSGTSVNVEKYISEEKEDKRFWLIGVLLSVLAAAIGALGDNLLRKSYQAERNVSTKSTLKWKRINWILGLLCILFSSGMIFCAKSLADATLLIPFSGLHIVFNIGFASRLNKETFSNSDSQKSWLILFGIVIVISSTNNVTRYYDLHDISQYFNHQLFITVSAVLVLNTSSLVILMYKGETRGVRCAALCLSCGCFGCFTHLFSKILAETVKAVFTCKADCGDLIRNEAFYIGLCLTMVFGIIQLALLIEALSKYKALIVSPLVNAVIVIVGTLYSLTFFNEYRYYDDGKLAVLSVGFIFSSIGVCLLAASVAKKIKDDEVVDSILVRNNETV